MIKNILWDFDGVILDSMPVREYGFKVIFKDFDDEIVEQLLKYHNQNGGLSRYVKIRYFYEKLLQQSISDSEVTKLAEQFSQIMKQKLINKKYLISDTIKFLESNNTKYNLHIVSGSDEKELRFLCKYLDIEKYFISINGSPIHKNDLVKNLLITYKYKPNETILIGDSINDYEAGKINNIDFYGYNNIDLKDVSKTYIEEFQHMLFFDYGIGEISHSKENKTFYNFSKNNQTFDYLLYFDSRALTINENNYNNTFLIKLLNQLKLDNKSYIAISRPKNTMIFHSLINFLDDNKNFSFKFLITNLGFVDYTPKKSDIINDMYLQLGKYKRYTQENIIDKYTLSSGKMNFLYSLEYNEYYIDYIAFVLSKNFEFSFIINTPIIEEDIRISRSRPKSFFTGLYYTNKLINEISSKVKNSKEINISNIFKEGNLKYTYDAVHYTEVGHSKIYMENLFDK